MDVVVGGVVDVVVGVVVVTVVTVGVVVVLAVVASKIYNEHKFSFKFRERIYYITKN